MSLIVTGSIGIDTIDTPTGRAKNVLGGSLSYFAPAASFFGPVRVVGAVGDDFPPSFVRTLKHFKIDLRGLERRRGSKSFRWHGKYLDNMNVRQTIMTDLNVLAEKLPPVPLAFRDSRFVFLANTHPAGQLELLANFPRAQLVVADTMDLWINTERPTLLRLLKKIDGLVLNDSEAQLLTGESNLVCAMMGVLLLGPRFVVMKKGEHGAMVTVRSKGHPRNGPSGKGQGKKGRGQGSGVRGQLQFAALPAWPAEKVIDPTGAGDSFAGGMMGYLASLGRPLKAQHRPPTLGALTTAMAYGTIVASFNIEAFGLNRLLKINRQDIERRFRLYRSMLAID